MFEADIIDYHNLFNTAGDEISIFTGNIDREYADEFIEAACRFATTPRSRLRIACQCGKNIQQCDIIRTILATEGRLGEIMVYDATAFRGEPYFILADRTGYRIEIPALSEIIIDFDDKEETLRLYDQFQQILQSSPLTAHALPMTMTN